MIIKVNLPDQSTDITVERGALSMAADVIMNKHRRVMIVSDTGVPGEYIDTLASSLGDGAHTFIFPEGEGSKSLDTLTELLRAMLTARINASSRSGTTSCGLSLSIPLSISAMISCGSSRLGLSDVTITRSASLEAMRPISALFSLSRSPPHPKTSIIRPVLSRMALALRKSFSSASGV